MKKQLIKVSTVALFTVFLISCGENKTSDNAMSEHEQGTETTSSASPIGGIVQHYIHLKNALVSSNAEEAKAGAKGLLDAIKAVDTTKFTGEQQNAWQQHIGMLKENAEHVAGSDLVHLREHLAPLSDALWAMVNVFGGGKILYYDFCPMANESKGGHWISEIEEIKNPYFGDEMLNCGETKETKK